MTGGGSSIPSVQRLLAVLATGRRVAELGTAFGDGAVAIASTAASLVTVEIDADRAEQARRRLAGFENVELLVGDWRDLLPPRAPFELVFLDAGADARAGDAAAALVAPGGLAIKDDLTPNPPVADAVREYWFGHPGFTTVEILTTPSTAAIVAARRV